MQIVIPMAGKGERFAKAGYADIKPLIPVHGKPMIEYVANLFPGEDDFVFVCNERHLAETHLRDTLLALKPHATIVSLEGHGQGAIYDILRSADAISDAEPVIINYCDFDMDWDYQGFKARMAERGADAASVCYTGFHPHLLGPNVYAGVRIGENGRTLEVREKHSFEEDKTRGWHQAGTFYFKSGALLKKYARELVASGETLNGEYYASMLFNAMIRDGRLVLVEPATQFCQWGTPEDLTEYSVWAEAVRAGSSERIIPNLDPERYRDEHVIQRAFAYWQKFFKKRP